MQKKRTAYVIRKSDDGTRAIAVDAEHADDILRFLNETQRRQNKFKDIARIILEGLRNNQLYGKENIDQSCKNISAMKFFPGQENDRIYCKEETFGGKLFVVIMAKVHRKKNQKISKKEKQIIQTIAKYDYEKPE